MLKSILTMIAIAAMITTLQAGGDFAGAMVKLSLKNNPSVIEAVICNADGSFTFQNAVPKGDYNLTINMRGRADKIMVIAVSHEIQSPRDAASGQATGKRQYSPAIFRKTFDEKTTDEFKVAVTVLGNAISGKISKSRSNIQNN